jgi:hypothetical protein
MKTDQAVRQVDQPGFEMTCVFQPPFQRGEDRSELQAVYVITSMLPAPPRYDTPPPTSGWYSCSQTVESRQL